VHSGLLQSNLLPQIFLEIDQLVSYPNMHIVPIKKTSSVEIKTNGCVFQYSFDKIYTTGTTPKTLKKEVLLPLLNTVIFEEKDSTIIIVGTNGVSKSNSSGIYEGFDKDDNILSLSLKYICEYQCENSIDER
jgi:hypothetical protein